MLIVETEKGCFGSLTQLRRLRTVAVEERMSSMAQDNQNPRPNVPQATISSYGDWRSKCKGWPGPSQETSLQDETARAKAKAARTGWGIPTTTPKPTAASRGATCSSRTMRCWKT